MSASATNTSSTSPATALPYERGSPSQLLSATHLFTVEVLAVEYSPWVKGHDGTEHRSIDLTLRVLEIFKGVLSSREHETFTFSAEQRRISELIDIEPPDLWTEAEPEPGRRYLVDASSEATTPAALLKEGVCRALYPPEYVTDVRLALEAEELAKENMKRHESGEDGRSETAKALISFAHAHRSEARDLFAPYLWTRIRAAFLQDTEQVLNEVLSLVASSDATREMRLCLLADLDEAVLDLAPDPTLLREVMRLYISILSQPESQGIHRTVLDVYLYNTIFDAQGEAQLSVNQVFPKTEERERLRSVVDAFKGNRAEQIAKWFRGAVP